MEKQQIVTLAHKMENKYDLLILLNRIKQDEMAEMGYIDKHPFTIKQINYYCNPKNELHRYKQFKIKKKREDLDLLLHLKLLVFY